MLGAEICRKSRSEYGGGNGRVSKNMEEARFKVLWQVKKPNWLDRAEGGENG